MSINGLTHGSPGAKESADQAFTRFLHNERLFAIQSVLPVNARTSYRVVYPESARPSLSLDSAPAAGSPGVAVPVVECSEGGLSFEAPSTRPTFKLGSKVRGCVAFQLSHGGGGGAAGDETDAGTKSAVQVSGEVVRVDGRLIALRLDAPGLPFRVLIREQIALRAQYPDWPAQVPDNTRATHPPLKLER